jgi:hypothetical protein
MMAELQQLEDRAKEEKLKQVGGGRTHIAPFSQLGTTMLQLGNIILINCSCQPASIALACCAPWQSTGVSTSHGNPLQLLSCLCHAVAAGPADSNH